MSAHDSAPAAPTPPASAGAGRIASVLGARGTERRRLVRNGLWTTGVFLANALVMFLLSPFVRKSLGNSAYGVWEVVISLTGYFGFADLGIKPAAVYFVARHDALKEPHRVNQYANTAFVVFAIAGGLVFLVSLACAPWFTGWFHVPAEQAADARLALIVTSASIAGTLPLHAYSAVVIGKQRYALTSSTDLVVLAAKTAATVYVLTHGGGILALAWIAMGADVLEMGAKSWLGFRAEPALRFHPKLADRASARGLLAFGLGAIIVNLAQLLVWRTDALVIGATIGAEAVAIFAVGSKIPFYARSMTGAASRVLAPAATRLDATGSKAELLRMLSRSSKTMLLVAGAMIAYLLAVGAPFLARWQGEEFRGEAFTVMAVLALGAIGPIAAQPFEHVLYGARKVMPLAKLSIIEGVLNLAISIALARPYGIVGVAIGTTIPGLLVRLVALPIYGVRTFGGKFGPFALRSFVVPIVACALTTFALKAFVSRESELGWPALLGLAAAAQVVFLAIATALTRATPRAWKSEPLVVTGGAA